MNQRLLRSLRDNPVKYAHLVGFDLLTDLHNEWIKEMVTGKEDYTLIAHRGSYKTTCMSFAFALLIVLKPNKTTFFMRKTDDDVIEIITQTKKILQSDTFKYIVKELYGIDFQLTTATAYKIDTNLNKSAKGQVQLQGMGINGSLTGRHVDNIFVDDVVTLKDRLSRAEREQTKQQFQELQNIKNRGGRIFCVGTPWHPQDCMSEKNDDGTPKYMKNQHRWSVYDTGLISPDKQEELRQSMSPSLYAANYELKHISDKETLFKDPLYCTDEDAESLIYDGIAQIDAAYGGGDYTAYTVMHELKDGRIIAYGNMWQAHVDQCIPDIKHLHALLRAGSIQCETNGDKGYLANELENMGFYVNTYSEKTNKYIKIATYLKQNWGRIYWLKTTDKNYMEQITTYTEFADHDDAPDSAASLVRTICDKVTLCTDELLIGGIV